MCNSDTHAVHNAGQVITAWGRVPFAPGPAMPAMQSTDPYLRQLLQQPLQVLCAVIDLIAAALHSKIAL